MNKKNKNNEKNKYLHLKINYIQILILIFVIIEWALSIKKYDKYNEKNIFKYNHGKTTYYDHNLLSNKINEYYIKNGFVNINEIESKIKNGRKWENKFDKENEINIGFQIDSTYVLRCMMTLVSIMDTQNESTKIRFHFAVVLKFNINDMLKIYSLREKIREDVEFNFYNASRVEKDLKGLNTKGPGAVAKLLLPQLLPNDIEKLIVFDTGDLLVLKDLTELYRWNFTGFMYAGVPARARGKYALISKKIFETYISVGSFLIDVHKVKEENMYQKFVKYKNYYNSSIGDQDLLNDVAFGKITYIPFQYGMISPFLTDEESSKKAQDNVFFDYINNYIMKKELSFLPRNETEFLKIGYGPYVIHHMHYKWMFGGGLTVYRRLAQYYIKYAGIWEELCQQYPGYCKM